MKPECAAPAPATQTVNKEAVRLLAIQIGVREAARRLDLNEDTVCSWAKRGNWFATPAVTYKPPAQAMQAPGDVMLQELEANGRATKLSLSRSAKRLAAESENATLGQSKHVLNVAKTAATISPELYASGDKNQAQVAVNIAILSS